MDFKRESGCEDRGCGNCAKANRILSNMLSRDLKEVPCPARYKVFALVHSALDLAYGETADVTAAVTMVEDALKQLKPKYEQHHNKLASEGADVLNRFTKK